MRARLSVILRIFPQTVLLAVVLVACRQSAPGNEPVQQTPVRPIARIVYEIRVGPGRKADATTFTRTVFFDGRRSATVERTDDYGFPGTTTILAANGDSSETYVKELPYLTFHLQRPRSGADLAIATVTERPAETKTILGHACRKIVLESSAFRFSIWYAPDIAVSDPTLAVLQAPDVPGLILEMTKTLKGKPGWSTQFVVTAFDRENRQAFRLEIPDDAIRVAEADEALSQNRLLFEQAMQREQTLTWEERQQFLGTWSDRRKGRSAMLRIERYGESYTFDERSPGNRSKGIARFYGNRLLLERESAYRTYYLDGETLRSDQDESLALRKLR